MLEARQETLTRSIVREMTARGDMSIPKYAEWIAASGDGSDENESAKDAALFIHLDIHDTNASDQKIHAGVDDALEHFEALGVAPAQAYIATQLMALDAKHIAAHSAAWDSAEFAACAVCFDGWAEWPESAVLVGLSDFSDER